MVSIFFTRVHILGLFRLCIYDLRTRSFIFFIIFIPSSRKTLFFHKKIKQLNEQFITNALADHNKHSLVLPDVNPSTNLNTT